MYDVHCINHWGNPSLFHKPAKVLQAMIVIISTADAHPDTNIPFSNAATPVLHPALMVLSLPYHCQHLLYFPIILSFYSLSDCML